MKSRWFSRGSLLSVALVTSIGVAACGQAQTSEQQTPEKAAAAAGETRGMPRGQRIFRQIDALDLSEDQREDLADIQQTLEADLATHRAGLGHAVEMLARGLEAGSLDTREAAANQEALTTAVSHASAAIAQSMNEVHAVLDADQREELVLSMRAQREQWREGSGPERGERRREGLTKIAEKLGLSDEQKAAIRGEIQARIDEVFPDRKAKRDAWEAKMNAMGDAFMSDDFHAEDFDLGADANGALTSFTTVARQAIDITSGVLDPTQRLLAASLLRSHAAKL